MAVNKIRVAVVGCGRVSRTAHYQAIAQNDHYEFVAVCDKDRARADEWAEKNGVKAYYSIEDLAAKETLDLVSINTPNGHHPRHAEQFARQGTHLIVEKPLAMRLDEADELIHLCDREGVRLFVVLQNRYNKTNKILKSCITNNRFGRITSCHVTVNWRRELDYYLEDEGWRGRRDLAGGVFTNQCIHYIDMMQWLVGAPVESVYAKMGTASFPVEVEDHGASVVRFKNGTIGSFALTNLTYPTDLEGSITITGEKGFVKIGGKSMNKVEQWHFADPGPEDDAIKEAETNPPTVYGFGHIEFYERVANYLLYNEGEREIITGRDGRHSVELLQAMYTSDRLGQEVRCPLQS